MPFDPETTPPADTSLPARKPRSPEVEAMLERSRREREWQTAHREWQPYWQQRDPVPPRPEAQPEIETPGEALTERQEAFCRLYVERPVAAKAAVAAGYSPATARQQASRLLKHPLVIRRIHELRDVRGKDWQVRRDTIIDQAEAVFEAAMDKADYYAAMQALTMKARLAGFADYLPGVRILRRETRDYEQEFWARAHAAEQRMLATRLGELAGGAELEAARAAAAEARQDAELHAEGAEFVARKLGVGTYDAIQRLRNAKG